MKQIVTTALLLFLFQVIALAQCPNSGSARLETQADVDEFVDLYPNCTELTRDLEIGFDGFSDPSADITDLSGLSNLTRIGQDFLVGHLDSLTYLEGLENITYVGRDFEIRQNGNLIDLNNFSQLDTIGRKLDIYLNENLLNLDHFTNLNYVGDDFDISFNKNLRSVKSFNLLTDIPGYFVLQDSPLLDNAEGFSNIETVGSRFSLMETNLTDMTGFSSLKSTAGEFGSVNIGNNLNLASLDGLENLETISSSFVVEFSPLLTSIDGLANLKSINGIFRFREIGIENVDALSNLELGKNGFIFIGGNENLQNIEGLNLGPSINGYLNVSNNPKLDNIYSLIEVDSIYGDLIIERNAILSSCSPICALLSQGFIEGSTRVGFNAEGCNNEAEIVVGDCTTSTYELGNKNLKIYPNPTQDFIRVAIDDVPIENMRFKVIDMYGKTLLSKILNNDWNSVINVSHLNQGLYYLILESDRIYVRQFSKL